MWTHRWRWAGWWPQPAEASVAAAWRPCWSLRSRDSSDQAGFLQDWRLQPSTTERESHFLRREGGWGVSAWGDGRGGGGGGGRTSSFVNVLAGNQGESLKGVPSLFLLFPLFCWLSSVFCHHASVVYFTSALSFPHCPPFPHLKLFLTNCYLSNLKTNTLTNRQLIIKTSEYSQRKEWHVLIYDDVMHQLNWAFLWISPFHLNKKSM